jgi:hypothetical protein
MSTTNEDEPGNSGRGNSNRENNRIRRLTLYVAVLLVVAIATAAPR